MSYTGYKDNETNIDIMLLVIISHFAYRKSDIDSFSSQQLYHFTTNATITLYLFSIAIKQQLLLNM